MKNIFREDSKDDKNTKTSRINMRTGGFKEMMEARAEMLPEIEKNIREALKNYNGQNMCLIVMDEDENGAPNGAQVLLCGVGRMETQFKLAETINLAADDAFKALVDGAGGDVDALKQVARLLKAKIEREL